MCNCIVIILISFLTQEPIVNEYVEVAFHVLTLNATLKTQNEM